MKYVQTEIGEMPLDWDRKPLTHLLSFIVDNRGKTAPTSDTGIPLIATNCIKEFGLYPVKEKVRFISDATYDTWFRSHPMPNDIIIVNKGTPGQVCLVPEPVGFCIAQDMVAIRADENEIDWRFLFAYLRSNSFKKQVLGLNVGTTIPHLKKTMFKQLQIPIPPREEQKIIGKIYYSLSGKIEINLQLNATLEQIAQTIFQRWFVEFEPVRANLESRSSESASPEIAKLFPSKFENGIPKGWRKGKLSDVVELAYGIVQPGIHDENGIPIVRVNNVRNDGLFLDDVKKVSKEIEKKYSRTRLEGGEVLLTLVGSIGQVAIAPDYLSGWNVARAICAIRPRPEIGAEWVYLSLRDQQTQTILNTVANTTVQTTVNLKDVRQLPIIIPDPIILNLFRKMISSFYRKRDANQKENQTLTQLRDSLLPKLMSGKIRVSGAEKML